MAKKKVKSKVPARYSKEVWKKNPIPEEIYKLYLKLVADKWENDALYNNFQRKAIEYLGTDDKIDQMKLIICLHKIRDKAMTLDFKVLD